MINRERLVKKIEQLPTHILEEVANYIDYIEFKKTRQNKFMVEEITLLSENSLSQDWLKPEEEKAWENL